MSHARSCPRCGRPLEAAEARWRPFCSERCRLADLGQWFAGRYSIPVDPEPEVPAPDRPESAPRQ